MSFSAVKIYDHSYSHLHTERQKSKRTSRHTDRMTNRVTDWYNRDIFSKDLHCAFAFAPKKMYRLYCTLLLIEKGKMCSASQLGSTL